MRQKTSLQEYSPGTVVFAKLKGYPWWPARIEAEQSVPRKILKQRAKSKSDLYTVLFFGTRDYGFFGPDALKPFDNVAVQKELDTKKYRSKDLELAVRQALDPTLLAQAIAEDGQNEEDEEEGEEEDDKKQVRKRRGRKIALDDDDDEVEDTAIGEKKRRMSMEDDGLKKTREYKEVYHMRHRLQRLVYNKEEGTIPTEDYPKILEVVKDIEEAPMSYDILKETKIVKVIKAACAYPFENDTVIRERCQRLMRNWKALFINPHNANSP